MGVTFNSGTHNEFPAEPDEEVGFDESATEGTVPPVAATSAGTPRPPGKRRVITHIATAAAALFAVWHIAATALYATPATPLRELLPEAAFTAYNYPMFDQNWSVFAPDPISSNYEISVRGAELVDGELVNTEWVNASETELKLLRHNPLSPRAGYAAYAQALGTYLAYNKLSDTEKAVVAGSYFEGDSWSLNLENDLRAQQGTDEATVNAYLKEEWVTTAYATQVAKAVWGKDVAYVQYSITVDSSVPFESRHDKNAQRSVITIDSGWRGLVMRPGQNSQHFADLFNSLDPVIIGEEDKK